MEQVDRYTNPEIERLKLEIKNLENEIGLLATEKGEIERQIHQYQISYNRELGEIIQKIFERRRNKLKEEAEKDSKKEVEYEEAERDYQEFKGEYEKSAHTPSPAIISEEEQIELKEKYRKACKKCHPDKVPEHLKEKAERIFIELKNAHEGNDLQKAVDSGQFSVVSGQNEARGVEVRADFPFARWKKQAVFGVKNSIFASKKLILG